MRQGAMKYRVVITEKSIRTYDVEADNEDEAKIKAEKMQHDLGDGWMKEFFLTSYQSNIIVTPMASGESNG